MRCRTHLLSVELIVLMEVRLKCGLRCEEHAQNKNELSMWKLQEPKAIKEAMYCGLGQSRDCSAYCCIYVCHLEQT